MKHIFHRSLCSPSGIDVSQLALYTAAAVRAYEYDHVVAFVAFDQVVVKVSVKIVHDEFHADGGDDRHDGDVEVRDHEFSQTLLRSHVFGLMAAVALCARLVTSISLGRAWGRKQDIAPAGCISLHQTVDVVRLDGYRCPIHRNTYS